MKNKIENLITGFKGQTFNSSEESIDYLRKHIEILLREQKEEHKKELKDLENAINAGDWFKVMHIFNL